MGSTVIGRLARRALPAAVNDGLDAYESALKSYPATRLAVVGEVLLDDAVRLAGRAAASDAPVVLEVTAHVHHVFQAVAAQLHEGDAALQRASAFLSQHLSGPDNCPDAREPAAASRCQRGSGT